MASGPSPLCASGSRTGRRHMAAVRSDARACRPARGKPFQPARIARLVICREESRICQAAAGWCRGRRSFPGSVRTIPRSAARHRVSRYRFAAGEFPGRSPISSRPPAPCGSRPSRFAPGAAVPAADHPDMPGRPAARASPATAPCRHPNRRVARRNRRAYSVRMFPSDDEVHGTFRRGTAGR